MHRVPHASGLLARLTPATTVSLAALLASLLTACASAPQSNADSVVNSAAKVESLLLAPLAASTDITAQDIANVDLTKNRQTDLWQRMRAGFAMPDLTTAAALDKTAWYAARGEYVKRSFERARPFLFHIVEELEKRGMPTELALLPLVESAYNPLAVSSAQAAGMWQFIPSTGKHYKLTQNWWRDERRDIIASTTAALDYLQMLHGMFGDWHLALAAYNWGEGAVGRAIERAKAKGEPFDYASLKMPAETAGYVPKLQAVKNLVMNPALYNLALPDVPNTPYFATITKDRDIDVKTAAKFADMPVADFVALNPAHNRPVIPGANKPVLILPADRVDTFKQNLQNSDGKSLSSWQAYLLKAGEKLDQVAKRFGIDLATLRSVNGISARSRLAPGHTLLVPKGTSAGSAGSAADDVAKFKAQEIALPANLAQPAVLAQERSVKTAYVVRRGDTLAGIAKKFNVSADDVKRSNKLSSASVAPGNKLVIDHIVVEKPGARKVAAKSSKKFKAAPKAKRAVKIARR